MDGELARTTFHPLRLHRIYRLRLERDGERVRQITRGGYNWVSVNVKEVGRRFLGVEVSGWAGLWQGLFPACRQELCFNSQNALGLSLRSRFSQSGTNQHMTNWIGFLPVELH
jgi:hypothetical protein